MKKYLIAGIKVGMTTDIGGTTESRARDYLFDFDGNADFTISINKKAIKKLHEDNPHLSLDKCEYILTCIEFCDNLFAFDGFMLHASAVVLDGKAYLFSAPSGTGKSTHTSIWQRVFGEDKTYILNDDKPVIKVGSDGVFVCGTPWSGKTDKNRNLTVPLGGICFLKRGIENSISEMSPQKAIFSILNQTMRPEELNDMTILLHLIERVISTVKVYDMLCNMEDEAAILAYETMSGKDSAVLRKDVNGNEN